MDYCFRSASRVFFDIIQDIPIPAKYGFHIRFTMDVSPLVKGLDMGSGPQFFSIFLTGHAAYVLVTDKGEVLTPFPRFCILAMAAG